MYTSTHAHLGGAKSKPAIKSGESNGCVTTHLLLKELGDVLHLSDNNETLEIFRGQIGGG